MKTFIRISLLTCLTALSDMTLRADTPIPPVKISSITNSNGQLAISWTGGRPTFQIQTRSGLSASWTNFGAPTSNSIAVVPITGSQAMFRVVSDFTARYQVVFHATWSALTHPTNFPTGSAHFSGLVGGTHGDSVLFWRDGETASEGIRIMAELGGKSTLLNEIGRAIANGAAHFQLSGGGIAASPGSVSLTLPQPMRRDFPLITLVSMIAPSPDWFVGVDGLNLIESGQWTSNKVVTLYGKDAGTDSGVSYGSPDLVTIPRGVVTQFSGFPALQNGSIVPFGSFTFTRLD